MTPFELELGTTSARTVRNERVLVSEVRSGEIKLSDFEYARHKTSVSHLPSKPRISKGAW